MGQGLQTFTSSKNTTTSYWLHFLLTPKNGVQMQMQLHLAIFDNDYVVMKHIFLMKKELHMFNKGSV